MYKKEKDEIQSRTKSFSFFSLRNKRFGCGCWAERKDTCSIAVASSGFFVFLCSFHRKFKIIFICHLGTGEFLMKSLFSKTISDTLATNDLTPEIVRNHLNNNFLSKNQKKPFNVKMLFNHRS